MGIGLLTVASNSRMPGLSYIATMLGIASVAAVLGAAAAYTTNNLESLSALLLQAAFWLLAVNLAGAAFFFRPIDRYLRGEVAERRALERRMRSLAAMSGLWLFMLAGLTMLGYVALTRYVWQVREFRLEELTATAVHIGVFALYLGLAGYLLVLDVCTGLRWAIWRTGAPLTARRGSLMNRLILVLLAVAVAPILIVVSDQWAGVSGEISAAVTAGHHDDSRVHQHLQFHLFGAVLLTALVIILMTRSFSRPVEMLAGAMQRVDSGDLDAKVPVLSDDEFGLLAEQFNRMIDGLRERRRMRKTFGRFVPEQLAARILASEGAIAPRESEATVLFADIEDFTALSSRMDPPAVLSILNACFEELAHIIHAHGGVITQFQGDEVLASFNLPASDPDHARHAVEAALAIEVKLQQTVFEGGLRLRTRTGISTGPVVGGVVGGGERLGYTVHGSTVNLAARLEVLNKEFGTRVLVSARTAELVEDSMLLRDRGRVVVRGFEEPLRVFEPVVRSGAAETA